MQTQQNITWVCTDPNTQQYGRKLRDWVFEFKEFDNSNNTLEKILEEYKGPAKDLIKAYPESWHWHHMVIDLENYSARTVEFIINAYGYTLEPWQEKFIFNQYQNKETVNWIIAECLFEFEIKLDAEY